jgi:hypothetical protein
LLTVSEDQVRFFYSLSFKVTMSTTDQVRVCVDLLVNSFYCLSVEFTKIYSLIGKHKLIENTENINNIFIVQKGYSSFRQEQFK